MQLKDIEIMTNAVREPSLGYEMCVRVSAYRWSTRITWHTGTQQQLKSPKNMVVGFGENRVYLIPSTDENAFQVFPRIDDIAKLQRGYEDGKYWINLRKNEKTVLLKTGTYLLHFDAECGQWYLEV